MFEEEYRKEMEAVGPDREQMERLLAAMEQKGRRPRPLRRTILLVAAACAAMVMTVVASAPTLRDTLEECSCTVRKLSLIHISEPTRPY